MNNELPLNLQGKVGYEKKHVILELDPKVFPECHSKEVKAWSWKKMKNIKFIVHHKGDGWDIFPLG